ncbi:MAG: VIT family protein [Acidimicrobiales bacterium]
MPSTHRHAEGHNIGRTGWLRAAVMGANDGIVSTASLVLGVAAATSERGAIFTAGLAALVAGALSMAVGEYVSVSSQRDVERADIAKERMELATLPERELDELTAIYQAKGLSPALAREVAVELSKGDVLAVHLREELGITDVNRANPLQAGWSSAASFAIGATLPLVAIVAAPEGVRMAVTFTTALAALALLGYLGARAGGAPRGRAMARTLIGGAAAMAITALVGALVGGAV